MQNYPQSETLTPEQNINNGIPFLFNFSFPIFDENYRVPLERKIIWHYYFREIGFETFGLFQFMLQRKLNEIMPYYNQLYETELLQFNPLYNRNFTEKYTGKGTDVENTGKNTTADSTQGINTTENRKENRTNDLTVSDTTNLTSETNTTASTGSKGTTNTKSDSTGSSDNTSTQTQNTETSLNQKHIHSDTPQGLLAMASIEDNVYASDAQINADTTSVQQTTDSTSKTTDSENVSTQMTSEDSTTSTGKVNASQDVAVSRTEDASENADSQKTAVTDVTKKDTQTVASTTNVNTTEDYVREIVGYDGTSPIDLINKFRESLLNIDMMVIGELNELFFSLWE